MKAQDLGIVMRYLEHWTHRLFPKMPFDEVLERIEKLGTKKEVQVNFQLTRSQLKVISGVDNEYKYIKKPDYYLYYNI